MLRTRVITGVILAVGVGLVVFAGTVSLFQGFVAVVFTLASWEWSNLAGIKSKTQRVAFVASALSLGAIMFYLVKTQPPAFLKSMFSIACIWWAVALLWVQSYPSSAILWGYTWARALLGCIVLIPSFIAIMVLREQSSGAWIIIAVVTLVAAADIGAYFSGKAFGKRKLAPLVSPGKSWEGVIGGIICVIVLTCVFTLINNRGDYFIALAIAVPTAFASVLGDLFESMVKRHRGIKDSGKILPGHGGVLDRIDGLTSAAPVFALAVLSTGWSL